MWQDDEDNNPYGSFNNQDPTNPPLSASYQDQPATPPSPNDPSSEPPEFLSRPNDLSEDEQDHEQAAGSAYAQKKGVYDGRIQQILYENPDLEILITDAGKSPDGSYIVYKIRTGDIDVARRYSEFSSLRKALVDLHPTLIIPPIPEKHTMADYAAKPTKAKEDTNIIDLRKRMLTVFLNRCRRMKDVLEDGVWWRFLDPNSSWNEVLHAHPVSSVPKNNLKAPPLDPANPSPAHNFLPIPSSSAKLKSASGTSFSGTPTSPSEYSTLPSAASHTIPGPQIFGRFPPTSQHLSEPDLDPYFTNFEAGTRELELLLQGSIEKVNRRTLEHWTKLSSDLAELGARYNGFSLSEQSQTVAAAIERVGQAVDNTYIETEELASTLGANFAEPMRESAQFAGVVRNVLRYRILKRVQQEMTRDELEKKKILLDSLERSELEAKRIDAYLSSSTAHLPQRSASQKSTSSQNPSSRREGSQEETESVDSDFPPTHGEAPGAPPSASQGLPQQEEDSAPQGAHRKSQSGNFVTNKIFGSFRQAVHGFVDVDPERTRRDQIGKTKESLVQLETALEVSEKDVKDASTGVLKDLKRFQKEKEDDIQRYLIAYARCHIDWAKKNLETWQDSVEETNKISRAATRGGQLILKTSYPKKHRAIVPKQPETPLQLSQDPPAASSWTAFAHSQTSSGPQPLTAVSPPLPQQYSPQTTTKKEASRVYGKSRRRSHTPSATASFASLALDPGFKRDMPVSDGRNGSQLRDYVLGRELRSSSPAVKRPASDMGAQDREEHTSDVDMDRGPSPPEASTATSMSSPTEGGATPKAKQVDTGSRHARRSSYELLASNSKASSQKVPSDETASNTSIAPSTQRAGLSDVSTAATSIGSDILNPSANIPSIDEQVAQVTQLVMKPLKDKQKGYVVSTKWLVRVMARSSEPPEAIKIDKSATEGEIGPIDNSDLVLIMEASGSLQDEANETFVPMRPGLQLDDDFQVFPEEAWKLVQGWYGVASNSPVITRFAHNTSEGEVENIQWELNPPIFSLLKLPAQQPPTSTSAYNERKTPVRTLASRSMHLKNWLQRAKYKVEIDMKHPVRIWKVLGGLKSSSASGVMTPAASRSASPAPGALIVASAGDRMILDVESFTALEPGSERELLDIKDMTFNDKYNGSQTLALAGLSKDEVIVLEEQITGPAGGEWPSDAGRHGSGLLSVSKSGAAADKAKSKGLASSGRSSPAPGIMTRGRQKKETRTKGITGLTNLGNTCYMNSALQCVRSVQELTQYFLLEEYKKELNPQNPLGFRGQVAKAYAGLLASIYEHNASSFSPGNFKTVIGRHGPNFSGYGQQDSQEFVLFLLDGLQEDLNRIKNKPYTEKPDSTDEMVHDEVALKKFADTNWQLYKARNDSVITDLFAGMYKSTVTCPICDKVSIIFDPFNNLTLQLPIENNWERQVIYFPLHSRPILIEIDMDKNASMRALKEFVAKRMNTDASRLIMAESYKNKFYKVFDDIGSIAEANIQAADDICLYEVDQIPTNYNPRYQKKQYVYSKDAQDVPPAINSPEAERLLIPVFNRLTKDPSSRGRQKELFAHPLYIVLSRQEAQDYDSVLRKVLGKVATFTTRQILSDSDELQDEARFTPEGSDTVVMHDDDSSSNSTKPQAASVEGEDDLVDVSLRNDSETGRASTSTTRPKIHSLLEPGRIIPPMLQNLFTMKAIHSGEKVPSGWNPTSEIENYPSISARATKRLALRPKASNMASGLASSHSSDEEGVTLTPFDGDASDESDAASIEHDAPKSEGSDQSLPSVEAMFGGSRAGVQAKGRSQRTYQRKKEPYDDDEDDEDEDEEADKPAEAAMYMIRPGEGILLDWNAEAFDAIFGGDPKDANEMRGVAAWGPEDVFQDEELMEKRRTRVSRRRNGITLDDCLNEYGKQEVLSEANAWYCPRCKEHRQAKKKFELWKTPDMLVMHLKRFSSNRNFRDKLDVKVDFPIEGLDLTGRVKGDEGDQSMIYDLIAVDNHYGGLGGGHYTAYAKNFIDDEWYEYNDSHVSRKGNPDAVVTASAYLLFYRRRSDHPLGGEKLVKMLQADSTLPADSNGSRDGSPSGEGRRLDDSSHNGSSSAFTVAGPAHHVGDGGGPSNQTRQRTPGAYPEDEFQATRIENDNFGPDDLLPSYEEQEHDNFIGPLRPDNMELDEDEGVDMTTTQPWNDAPGWGFSLNRTLPTSQQMAIPPNSVNDFSQDQDEDLFADGDRASTKAEGGDGSSVAGSDPDLGMGDFHDAEEPAMEPLFADHRGARESAPPPLAIAQDDEEEDELPIYEIPPPLDDAEGA